MRQTRALSTQRNSAGMHVRHAGKRLLASTRRLHSAPIATQSHESGLLRGGERPTFLVQGVPTTLSGCGVAGGWGAGGLPRAAASLPRCTAGRLHAQPLGARTQAGRWSDPRPWCVYSANAQAHFSLALTSHWRLRAYSHIKYEQAKSSKRYSFGKPCSRRTFYLVVIKADS